MSKELLRKQLLKKRKEISNKKELDIIIKKKVLSNPIIKEAENILIYVSKNDEVDTKEIIKELLSLDKKIFVPKIDDSTMNFYCIHSLKDLQKGHFNILEPITNEKIIEYSKAVIIVPGIAFDKKNNRIGYGKGYYDRFLADKDLYKIGISYPQLIVDKIITDSHDIKMNVIITSK